MDIALHAVRRGPERSRAFGHRVRRIPFVAACAALAGGLAFAGDFDGAQCLGRWYEIARIDSIFERNMSDTAAECSANGDGTLAVTERGYNTLAGKWVTATGKGSFRPDASPVEIDLSFFWPFSSGYWIIAIDPGYNHALIRGRTMHELWIVSRTTTIPDEARTRYLDLARSAGYDVAKLVWVEQGRVP